MTTPNAHGNAKQDAFARLRANARPAVEAALTETLGAYDRASALSRFHRLSQATISSETPEAARSLAGDRARLARRACAARPLDL
jgi:hypothetical protein